MKIFRSSILPWSLVILAIHSLVLAITGPLWEIDSNAYLQGGFTWSVYHNPLVNLLYAGLGHIWKHPGFLIWVQMLLYAFASGFLISRLTDQTILRLIFTLLCALEPAGLYYHLNLLSESVYLSLGHVFLACFISYLKNRDRTWLGLAALSWALLFACRLEGLLPGLPFAIWIVSTKENFRARIARLALFVLPVLCAGIAIQMGKNLQGQPVFLRQRPLLDFALSHYDATHDPPVPGIDPASAFVLPEARREAAYTGFKFCLEEKEKSGMPFPEAERECDRQFGQLGWRIFRRDPAGAFLDFWSGNLTAVFKGNYLDYRHSEGLAFQYPDWEYRALDSLIRAGFSYSVKKENVTPLPFIWRSTGFANLYFGLQFCLLLAFLLACILHKQTDYRILILGLWAMLPWLLHILFFAYRSRFIVPALLPPIFGLILCFYPSLSAPLRRIPQTEKPV